MFALKYLELRDLSKNVSSKVCWPKLKKGLKYSIIESTKICSS